MATDDSKASGKAALTKGVSIRVTAETHKALVARSTAEDVSLSAYTASLVTNALFPKDDADHECEETKPDEVQHEPVPTPEPDYPVDRFGVRIPVLIGQSRKGRCGHCGAFKLRQPVPVGDVPNERRYELWCDWCAFRYRKEIGK